MADDIKKGFKIWIPRLRTPFYSVIIDGDNVTNDVISAEFTRGILGVENPCRITLIDTDGTYAKAYTGRETIEFFYDFTDGTRSQWKGTLDMAKKKFGLGYSVEVIGSHYQADTLDITVTEKYTDQTADAVLKDIVAKYLTGFTFTNVTTSTTEVTVTWNNKPLYDCILDICEMAGYDAYVDSDKDFHFFLQESIENSSDAIIWNDTLLDAPEWGDDEIDVKNRVIVYGEDDNGLPIIYQTDNTASQTTHGVKELIQKDSSVKTFAQAKNLGDGLLAAEKEKVNKGEFECLLLPFCNPGDMVWITNPVQDVHTTARLIKHTMKLPLERSNMVMSRDKTIPTLFKERKKKELAAENILNEFKMEKSLNLTFDDAADYDSASSSTIQVADGKLQVATGSASGVMVSARRTEDNNITQCYLRVVGDALAGNTYYISANDGGDYQEVNLQELTVIVASGKNLRVKINLTDANTRVDSIVVMYK